MADHAKSRRYSRKIRLKAIAIMGGRCMRCGFNDERALHFDHIKPLRRGLNGLSKSAGTGRRLHAAIVRGKRSGFQLLCANCHAIKSREDERAGRMSINLSRTPGLKQRLLGQTEAETPIISAQFDLF